MKLTAVILDDEQDAIEILRKRLTQWAPSVEVIKVCDNIKDALLAIVQHKPDLLFLDIEMPEVNGLQFFRYVSDMAISLQCIIVSGYPEAKNLKEALRLGLADFIEKPLIKEELVNAIEKVKQKMMTRQHHHTFLIDEKNLTKVNLPVLNGFIRIAPEEILCAESDEKMTTLSLTNNSIHHINMGLSEVEKILSHSLQRIDRFTLINIHHVKQVIKKDNKITFITQTTDKAITVSKVGIEKMLLIMKKS